MGSLAALSLFALLLGCWALDWSVLLAWAPMAGVGALVVCVLAPPCVTWQALLFLFIFFFFDMCVCVVLSCACFLA